MGIVEEIVFPETRAKHVVPQRDEDFQELQCWTMKLFLSNDGFGAHKKYEGGCCSLLRSRNMLLLLGAIFYGQIIAPMSKHTP